MNSFALRVCVLLLIGVSRVFAQAEHDHSQHQHTTETAEASSHVPPAPPSEVLPPMSTEQMHSMMEMDDSARFGSVKVDRLEWRDESDSTAWNLSARYGGDYNKLVLKSEGDIRDHDRELRNELLWDRIIGAWWNLQAGVRVDSGTGPTRTWAAFGIEGLAPYWIDFESTLYVSDEGRTALRVEARYDLRFTQRLILQPQLEANAYGKSDPERALGSGLSDLEAGLRLRYEFRREIAPYIGVQWTALFGTTADLAESENRSSDEVQFVAGIRVWF
ncbi:MAG: copper resistance protein B [Povalibacter sp.]